MSQPQPTTMAPSAQQSPPPPPPPLAQAQARAFSPQQQQHSPSPTVSHQVVQQQMRPRASPDPRSPSFPAGTFPTTASGQNTPIVRTPTSGLASPSVTQYTQHPQHTQHAQHQAQHQSSYAAPYTANHAQQNGRLTPGSAPQRFAPPQPTPTPGSTTHHPSPTQASNPSMVHSPQVVSPATQTPHNYATSTFSPQPTASPGPMAPPPSTLPKAAVPAKTYAYEMDDTLAGTGINLDEEEQFMNDYETRTGFGALVPGGRGSFYGAGPVNQPPEKVNGKTQEELVADAADRAWNDAAHRYGAARAQDFLEGGFIHPGMLHARMNKMAAANNLELNLDPKPPNPSMPLGRFSNPNNWEKPQIKVTTKTSPDGTLVATEGSFLPKDAYLIDQIALLSLATKVRIGELLADATMISTHRQNTAHGIIPPEWADAAETQPMDIDPATSPSTNKRPSKEMSNGLPTPVSESAPLNRFAGTIFTLGKRARDSEEARLKKRRKRAEQATDKEKNPDGTASRSGSAAPSAGPGSVAPEQPEAKPMTKKDTKKAARLQDTSSLSVNSTVSQFMGKKGKKYSWMTGGGGSGANTPKGAPGGAPGTAAPGGRTPKGPLTQDPSQKLGKLREDSAKGRNIQMRDWIDVLERHAILTDRPVLQQAYIKLDRSDWGDKAKPPAPAPAAAIATKTAPPPTTSAAATPAVTPAATPASATPAAVVPSPTPPSATAASVGGAATPVATTPMVEKVA